MRCLPTEITHKPDILLKLSAPPERRTEGKWKKRKQAQGGKNWLWGTESWEEVFWTLGGGEGGMTWENGIETCIIPYVKQIASPGSMHETGCSGLVHWDDPEGQDKEGGGRGVQVGEHMYTHG